MSEEIEKKLIEFLNDTYNNCDWNNLIDFINENFITKEKFEMELKGRELDYTSIYLCGLYDGMEKRKKGKKK